LGHELKARALFFLTFGEANWGEAGKSPGHRLDKNMGMRDVWPASGLATLGQGLPVSSPASTAYL